MLTRSLLLFLLGTGLLRAESAAAPFTLGANFNEHLDAATVPLLDAGRAQWIRGFLPATEFLDGPRRLASDPRLAVFHAAARTGRNVALSLKWDFKGADTRVPAPDSPRETACFQWALDVVTHGKPDLLCLVNEVFVDTMETDLQPGADGTVPMVRFLQRLAAHLHRAGLTTPDGRTPLPLSCGGFTRLDTPPMQNHAATRALLAWLAGSPEVGLVNFHLHHDGLDDFATALAFVRRNVPGKPLVITEFSLVWRYRQNLGEKLGRDAAGQAFAGTYRLATGATVLDYLNACLARPVPEAQFHAFLRSRTWFDPGFLDKACQLMRQHGVILATYAYSQAASGGTRPLHPGDTPWRLNPVFINLLALSPDPARPAANLGFYDTFLRHQR